MRAIAAKEVWRVSGTANDDDLAALVRRVTEAAEALISGDIEGYTARIKHAHDYTLMSPYGGEPVRGFDDSDEALEGLARFFRGGEVEVEVVETHASGDLAVLVVIERQHGTIGDLPEQDWSLRGLPADCGIRVGARPSSRRMRSCMPSITSDWGHSHVVREDAPPARL